VADTSLANSYSRKNELKRIIKSNGKIAIEKIPFIKREDIINSVFHLKKLIKIYWYLKK